MSTPEPRCPECRLTLQKLDLKFGLVPRHSRYLSDRAGKLDLGDMDAVREDLRLFERKFPQVLLSVFVTDLPAGTSVREYAFWLANRARFTPIQKSAAENFDMLLVIDLLGNNAALIASYGLEMVLPEADLDDALAELAKGMSGGSVPDGIRACLKFLTKRVRQRSIEARRAPASQLAEASR
jgi:uncharacterized membrane protein YgcG